uniref:Peptidase M12B domain-containing protein n=1 Tax=Macrostomum lignano TaxID=282301 RepID=A0A1I8I1T5_9PLAT
EPTKNESSASQPPETFHFECRRWPLCVTSEQLGPDIATALLNPANAKLAFAPYTKSLSVSLYRTSEAEPLLFELEKARVLDISDKFQVRHWRVRSSIMVSGSMPHCYYTGRVKQHGRYQGSAYVDLCNKIMHGYFTYQGLEYVILPVLCTQCRPYKPYFVMRYGLADPRLNQNITRDPNVQIFYTSFTALSEPRIVPEQILDRLKLGWQPGQIPPKDFKLRLGIIVDHQLFSSLDRTMDRSQLLSGRLTNLMGKYFAPTRVAVSLLLVEVWNLEDQFPISSDIRATLHGLLNYSLAETARERDRTFDSLLLLSSQVFVANTEHLSVPDSVCTSRAVSVVQVTNLADELHVAKLMSLAVAEQFGMLAFPCASDS